MEPVKVMFQLSGCNEYGVYKFLNLSVPGFGLVEHLIDEIAWVLNTISVAGLLVLDHQDSGNDSISRGNVKLKDFS
jgi:ABC-type transporter MlaC component